MLSQKPGYKKGLEAESAQESQSTESSKFAEIEAGNQQKTEANPQQHGQLNTQCCLGKQEVFQSF